MIWNKIMTSTPIMELKRAILLGMFFWIIIILFLSINAVMTSACKDTYKQSEEVIITDIIEEDGLDATCNLTLYWGNTFNQTGEMNQSGLAYSYNASKLLSGIYSASILCLKVDEMYIGECKFKVQDEDQMIFLALILAPLFLGIFFLIGAATLNEEHKVLKIFLFLLSIPSFFASMHIGAISLVKLYDIPELENAIGDTVYWVGLVFFVVIAYFIIYIFYSIIQHRAQKKKEKLVY